MKTVSRASTIAVALASLSSAPAWAQPTASADAAYIAEFYAALATDADTFRAAIEAISGPIEDDIWAVYARHMMPVIEDPAYAAYVTERLPEALDPAVVDATLAAFVGWGNALAYGMLRLPQTEQEVYLRVGADVYSWISENQPEACPEVDRGARIIAAAGETILPAIAAAARPLAELEFQFYAAEGETYLDGHMTIVAAAITAEIHATPAPRTLGSGLIVQQAMAAYERAFLEKLQTAPNAEAILQAAAAIGVGAELTDPGPLCDVGVLSITALWDLSPADRTVAVLAALVSPIDPDAVQRALGFR
ncbi:MAG: hypothetical protein AB7O56_10235 [Bauldia sp.]